MTAKKRRRKSTGANAPVKKRPAAQVAPALKAAKLKAESKARFGRPPSDDPRLTVESDAPRATPISASPLQPRGPPQKHHLDKRAAALAAEPGNDDALLTVAQCATGSVFPFSGSTSAEAGATGRRLRGCRRTSFATTATRCGSGSSIALTARPPSTCDDDEAKGEADPCTTPHRPRVANEMRPAGVSRGVFAGARADDRRRALADGLAGDRGGAAMSDPTKLSDEQIEHELEQLYAAVLNLDKEIAALKAEREAVRRGRALRGRGARHVTAAIAGAERVSAIGALRDLLFDLLQESSRSLNGSPPAPSR